MNRNPITGMTVEETQKAKAEKSEKTKIDFKKVVLLESPDILKYCGQLPSRYQNRFMLAYLNRLSLRKTLELKCADCVGYENVIDEVRACNLRSCPLWHNRPFKLNGK